MSLHPTYYKRFAQLADLITVIISIFLAYKLWKLTFKYIPLQFVSPPINYNFDYFLVIPTLALLFIWFLNYFEAYSFNRFTSLLKEFLIVLKSTILWIFIGSFVLYMFTHEFIQRTYLIIEFITVIILLLVQKTVFFFLVNWIRLKGFKRQNVILVDSQVQKNSFIKIINNKVNFGINIIGVLVSNEELSVTKYDKVPIIGTFKDIESCLKQYCPDEVIINYSKDKVESSLTILEVCIREGVPVRIVSDYLGHLSKKIHFDRLYGYNIVSFDAFYQSEFQKYLKRLIDISGSILAIMLFLPLMIISGIGILVSDGLPLFYSWNVVGLNKKPFRSWKFRTMVKNADEIKERLMQFNEMSGPVFKISNDPRIIPFGRWLRKYSIDETPQLFSVLKGDMSLVGPRPAYPNELDLYESWHRRKLSIKPGITCLWQVSGRNAINNFDEWVKLDLKYIDNWSIWLDLKIIFKTILSVFKADGK